MIMVPRTIEAEPNVKGAIREGFDVHEHLVDECSPFFAQQQA